MFRLHWMLPLVVALAVFADSSIALAQQFPLMPSREEAIVQNATLVLSQSMAAPGRGIPARMLAEAEGVAIIPGMIRGGFVVGVRHGQGVLLVRGEDGAWQAPVFITMTGGNIGWQVGVQSSDLILVFRTKRSVQGVFNGKFTIGADASAAAGPVGRDMGAATDARLQAEIYSYSRSRGLFVGVALDGTSISMDPAANAAFYQPGGPATQATVPQSAVTLVSHLAAYSGAVAPVVAEAQPLVAQGPTMIPGGVQPRNVREIDAVRDQLVASTGPLFAELPPAWTGFLALPPQLTAGQPIPLATVQQTLGNYNKVASDPAYQALTSRQEFKTTHALLQQFATLRQQEEAKLNLPPPPGQPGAPAPLTPDQLQAAPGQLQPGAAIPPGAFQQPAPLGPWRPAAGEPSTNFSTLPQ